MAYLLTYYFTRFQLVVDGLPENFSVEKLKRSKPGVRRVIKMPDGVSAIVVFESHKYAHVAKATGWEFSDMALIVSWAKPFDIDYILRLWLCYSPMVEAQPIMHHPFVGPEDLYENRSGSKDGYALMAGDDSSTSVSRLGGGADSWDKFALYNDNFSSSRDMHFGIANDMESESKESAEEIPLAFLGFGNGRVDSVGSKSNLGTEPSPDTTFFDPVSARATVVGERVSSSVEATPLSSRGSMSLSFLGFRMNRSVKTLNIQPLEHIHVRTPTVDPFESSSAGLTERERARGPWNARRGGSTSPAKRGHKDQEVESTMEYDDMLAVLDQIERDSVQRIDDAGPTMTPPASQSPSPAVVLVVAGSSQAGKHAADDVEAYNQHHSSLGGLNSPKEHLGLPADKYMEMNNSIPSQLALAPALQVDSTERARPFSSQPLSNIGDDLD